MQDRESTMGGADRIDGDVVSDGAGSDSEVMGGAEGTDADVVGDGEGLMGKEDESDSEVMGSGE